MTTLKQLSKTNYKIYALRTGYDSLNAFQNKYTKAIHAKLIVLDSLYQDIWNGVSLHKNTAILASELTSGEALNDKPVPSAYYVNQNLFTKKYAVYL